MNPNEVMDAVISLIRPGIWQPMNFMLFSGKVIFGAVRGVRVQNSETIVEILDSSTELVIHIPLASIQKVEIRLRA